jgi:hypothetical protein
MVALRIISKKGSKACKAIKKGTGISGYTGKTRVVPDGIINYGLPKTGLDVFFRRYPSARKIGLINRHVGYSKYGVCRKARDKGIEVPESKLSLDRSDKPKEWIRKLTNSIGGKGIKIATGKNQINGGYYQRFIDNRIYELRVHAFKWLQKEDWSVQKRVGDKDVIAWNYKNGGHFITVKTPQGYNVFKKAVSVSSDILDMLGMSFGAVDFLVTSDYDPYFIEVNSAPGFSDLSKPIYINAFNELKKLSKGKLLEYTN